MPRSRRYRIRNIRPWVACCLTVRRACQWRTVPESRKSGREEPCSSGLHTSTRTTLFVSTQPWLSPQASVPGSPLFTAEVRPSRMPSRRSKNTGKLGKARCRRLAPHDLGLLPSTGVEAERLRWQMPYVGRLVFGSTVATKGLSLSVSRDYLVEVHVVRSATAAQLRKYLHGRGTKLIEVKPGSDDWIIRINMTRDGLKRQ